MPVRSGSQVKQVMVPALRRKKAKEVAGQAQGEGAGRPRGELTSGCASRSTSARPRRVSRSAAPPRTCAQSRSSCAARARTSRPDTPSRRPSASSARATGCGTRTGGTRSCATSRASPGATVGRPGRRILALGFAALAAAEGLERRALPIRSRTAPERSPAGIRPGTTPGRCQPRPGWRASRHRTPARRASA